MIQPLSSNFLTPATRLRRLSVLIAVQDSPRLSQHKIARMTRLSSSMVNNYIKRLRHEGLIQITGNTNRTQGYHLTPAGHDELMVMILEYSSEIIQLYTNAKRRLAERLQHLHSEGIRSIALFGAAETAEVVYAALKDTPLSVLGIVDNDPFKQGSRFNGFTVKSPLQLKEMAADAVVITSFAKQEEIYMCIRQVLGDEIKVKKLSDL